MPAKAKPVAAIDRVFVVLNKNGVDGVYATAPSANERAAVLKADAADPSSIKVE